MTKKYLKEMQAYAKQLDDNQISTLLNENLMGKPHKMFIEGEILSQEILDCFDIQREEFFAFEKVDLIDYWNYCGGRTNQTR